MDDVSGFDVLIPLQRKSDIGHSQLLPLVDVGGALHAKEQDGEHFGGLRPICPVVAPAGDDARQVVVFPEQAVPARPPQLPLPAAQDLLEAGERQGSQVPFLLARLLVQKDVLKLKDHGELAAVRRAVELCPFRRGAPRLADGDEAGLGKGFPAHLPDIFVQPRTVDGEAPVRILSQVIDHVQAKAAHAPVRPPADHVVQLPAQLGVLPVQIRLGWRELQEIVLTKLRNIGPGGAAETRPHIVGRLVRGAGAPDIVVIIGALRAGFCREEPGMPVGGMVEHQVHEDADASLIRLPEQTVHVLQGPEDRIDIPIVRDIVAIVVLGGTEDRGEPDGVHAQCLEIVQLLDDPGQVADAVAIAVPEAAGIDLIDDPALPPVRARTILFLHESFSFVVPPGAYRTGRQ